MHLVSAMQRRLEGFYTDLAGARRPRPGPTREELIELIEAAVPREPV